MNRKNNKQWYSSSNTKQPTGTVEHQANYAEQTCRHIEAFDTIYMCSEGDKVPLKVTGAGSVATKALAAGELPPPHMIDTLHEIYEAARLAKPSIVVDAESQYFQKGIARAAVEPMRRYNTRDDTFTRLPDMSMLSEENPESSKESSGRRVALGCQACARHVYGHGRTVECTRHQRGHR